MGEDLAYILFELGLINLHELEIHRLEKLVKKLQEIWIGALAYPTYETFEQIHSEVKIRFGDDTQLRNNSRCYVLACLYGDNRKGRYRVDGHLLATSVGVCFVETRWAIRASGQHDRKVSVTVSLLNLKEVVEIINQYRFALRDTLKQTSGMLDLLRDHCRCIMNQASEQIRDCHFLLQHLRP